MNDYLIFFGLGVIVGVLLALQGALVLAKKWAGDIVNKPVKNRIDSPEFREILWRYIDAVKAAKVDEIRDAFKELTEYIDEKSSSVSKFKKIF